LKFSNLAFIEIISLIFFCFFVYFFGYYLDNFFGSFDLDPTIMTIERWMDRKHSIFVSTVNRVSRGYPPLGCYVPLKHSSGEQLSSSKYSNNFKFKLNLYKRLLIFMIKLIMKYILILNLIGDINTDIFLGILS